MRSESLPFSRRSRRCFGPLLAALLLAFGCQSDTEPTGGETHFLTRCQTNANTCGSGLTCLCGVCTAPCAERAACRRFPLAECVASSGVESCGDSSPQGHCDVRCIIDADCAVVSPAHRCDQGSCRVGSPPLGTGGASSGGASTGGLGGSGGSESIAGTGGTSGCPHGDVSANEVLLVGDSFLASSHQITGYLEDRARSAGALSAGERYRDNSRSVGNSLALGGNGIADEYANGIAEAPAKVVIMNGGGADVLIGSCDSANSSCPLVVAAASALRDLLSRMATDGVLHVVYAFYPDPVDAGLRQKMDALRPLVQSACESSPVPCHWLDLRPIFAGHYDEYVQSDGMNPTAAGSQASAAAIWELLQQRCIAQ